MKKTITRDSNEVRQTGNTIEVRGRGREGTTNPWVSMYVNMGGISWTECNEGEVSYSMFMYAYHAVPGAGRAEAASCPHDHPLSSILNLFRGPS